MRKATLLPGPTADMSEDDNLLLMNKQKKNFDYMTSNVLKEQQKHLLASLHFKAVYDYIMFLPSIGITLLTGILAVIAQSNTVSTEVQSIFIVCISILSPCSVFWQSLIKQLNFGGKAAIHDSTATALTHLFNLAILRSRESKASIGYNPPNNTEQPRGLSTSLERLEAGVPVSAGATDQESRDKTRKSNEVPVEADDDHFTLSQQFEQATQGCTSLIPIKITTAFNVLESRVNVSNKKLVAIGTKWPKIAWEKVYPALYYQLTLTIIGSRGWPYVVPNAEWAVNKTIKDFQKMDGYMLEDLVSRAKKIDDQYNSLVTEPSLKAPLIPASSTS